MPFSTSDVKLPEIQRRKTSFALPPTVLKPRLSFKPTESIKPQAQIQPVASIDAQEIIDRYRALIEERTAQLPPDLGPPSSSLTELLTATENEEQLDSFEEGVIETKNMKERRLSKRQSIASRRLSMRPAIAEQQPAQPRRQLIQAEEVSSDSDDLSEDDFINKISLPSYRRRFPPSTFADRKEEAVKNKNKWMASNRALDDSREPRHNEEFNFKTTRPKLMGASGAIPISVPKEKSFISTNMEHDDMHEGLFLEAKCLLPKRAEQKGKVFSDLRFCEKKNCTCEAEHYDYEEIAQMTNLDVSALQVHGTAVLAQEENPVWSRAPNRLLWALPRLDQMYMTLRNAELINSWQPLAEPETRLLQPSADTAANEVKEQRNRQSTTRTRKSGASENEFRDFILEGSSRYLASSPDPEQQMGADNALRRSLPDIDSEIIHEDDSKSAMSFQIIPLGRIRSASNMRIADEFREDQEPSVQISTVDSAQRPKESELEGLPPIESASGFMDIKSRRPSNRIFTRTTISPDAEEAIASPVVLERSAAKFENPISDHTKATGNTELACSITEGAPISSNASPERQRKKFDMSALGSNNLQINTSYRRISFMDGTISKVEDGSTFSISSPRRRHTISINEHSKQPAPQPDPVALPHTSRPSSSILKRPTSTASQMSDGMRVGSVVSELVIKEEELIPFFEVKHSEKMILDHHLSLIDKPRERAEDTSSMLDSETHLEENILLTILPPRGFESDETAQFPFITETITPEEANAEIVELTESIQQHDVPPPASLRRLSLLEAKLGNYDEALRLISQSIMYDSAPAEGYWIRHQLYLQKNEITRALYDLEKITDTYKSHYGAWLARARLLKHQTVFKQALQCYNACVRLRPESAQPVFERGQIHEIEGNTMQMLEDYRATIKLMPQNKHAALSLAQHSFQKSAWSDALHAFTRVIMLDPFSGSAYSCRGRVYAQLKNWEEALSDLTNAVKLAPSSAENYFYRGCLFRDRNKHRAIRDFSISLLLDHSINNVDSYYFRGICYSQLHMYHLAILDYDAAVKLDPTKSSIHLNLGLIFSKKMLDTEKALIHLNAAINHDPILVRAYITRAELYYDLYVRHVSADLRKEMERSILHRKKKVDYLQLAINDYTKAIHLQPKNHIYYISRGRILLKQFKINKAQSDFEVAISLNQGSSQDFLTRAIVLSFQAKYAQIIKEFDVAKAKGFVDLSVPLIIILAKSKFHLKEEDEAIKVLDDGLNNRPDDLQLLINRGHIFIQTKNYKKAVADFTKVTTLDSRNAKGYYYRGLARIQDGDSRGHQDLTRAIKCNVKYFDAFMTRASFYNSKGDFALALLDCNEAVKLDPSNLQTYLLRGTVLSRMGKFNEALLDFGKAITLDVNGQMAFYYRAIACHRVEKYVEALQDYSISLILAPDHAYSYRNRGLIYWTLKDYENAIADFYAAQQHFPEDAELGVLLGWSLMKLQRTNEALEAYTKCIKMNPFAVSGYLSKGTVYMSIGEYDLARMSYSRAIKINPRCFEAMVNIAYSFQMQFQHKKAYHMFNNVLAMDPDNVAALEGRAIIMLTAKHPLGALFDISKALDHDKENSEMLVNRGVIYQSLGDNERAAQDYKRAISLNPDYPISHFNLGNLHTNQQCYELALQNFSRAIELDSTDGLSYMNRGIVRAILKDYEQALQDYHLALERIRNPSLVYYNRAKVYSILEQFDQAEADYLKTMQLNPSSEPTVRTELLTLRRSRYAKKDVLSEQERKQLIKTEMQAYAQRI